MFVKSLPYFLGDKVDPSIFSKLKFGVFRTGNMAVVEKVQQGAGYTPATFGLPA